MIKTLTGTGYLPLPSPIATRPIWHNLGSVPLPETLRAALLTATRPIHFQGRTYLVYDGPADEVRLQTWMPRFPPSPPFTPLTGTNRWFLGLPLPATARIEYRLLVKQAARWHEIDDPLNPPTASNPFGVNSVISGPEYRPAVIPAPKGEVGESHLVEIRVSSLALGGRRHYHVYLPPGFQRGVPLPLLFVHDGEDFARFGGLIEALTGLISTGSMAPLAAVLLDPWQRLNEYGADPAHARHVVEEVIPHLHRRVGVVSPPSSRGLLGSSLGAVASLASAWHYPDTFNRLGLLSGTFVHQPGDEWPLEAFAGVISLMGAFTAEQRLEGYRVYASVGRYEGLIDFHRRLAPRLHAAGAMLRSRETWDGHHWGAWRDRLVECLPYLFPGPGSLLPSP